jgi:hypothetical protein
LAIRRVLKIFQSVTNIPTCKEAITSLEKAKKKSLFGSETPTSAVVLGSTRKGA